MRVPPWFYNATPTEARETETPARRAALVFAMLLLVQTHLAVAIRVARLLPGAAEPPQRSLVSAPTATTAATAAPLQLLAFVDDSEAAVGSLRLEQESEFAVRASSLRLPEEEHDEVARQLLWHAVREMPALRRESALLACPASEEDVGALHSLGFAPISAGEEAKTLALVTRRDPAEPAGFSHVTLRVSSIKTSLAFWSLLHYAPSRTFTSNGARTAWLSAPWTALSVELIEVPEVMLSQMAKSLLTPSTEALGPAHLCLDVTALGVALPSTLELLQQRSAARFDRTLSVLVPPHQQMMGDLVSEVAQHAPTAEPRVSPKPNPNLNPNPSSNPSPHPDPNPSPSRVAHPRWRTTCAHHLVHHLVAGGHCARARRGRAATDAQVRPLEWGHGS